jgi:uncharacterized protein (DUF849 family)
MQIAKKVIITCAPTGSVHTPSMSPYLPITPEEITKHAVGAAKAGASIIHLHARNADGSPSPDPAMFERFLGPISNSTDAVINITTGGSAAMSVEERLEAPLRFSPELCSLNMGSMNFDFSAAADRVTDWKYGWEKDFILGARDRITYNTPAVIERLIRDLGEGHGTRFEFECYDISHLYMLAHFIEMGLAKPPFFIQCIFGVLGGMGVHASHLSHMVLTADRLFGDDYQLSVIGAGRHQINLAAMSFAMGGNARVGLEDSLYISRGELARSNADQVAKVRRIAEELSLEIATPEETRAILKLKGAGQTKIS